MRAPMKKAEPLALPLLGHIAGLAFDPLGFLARQHRRGPVVRLRIGGRSAYLVTTPALARAVMSGEDGAFDKGGPVMQVVRGLLGDGLITCSSDEHPAQRGALQPAFHRERLRAYAQVMGACVEQRVGGWQDGDVIDVAAEMGYLAAQVVTRTLISEDDDDRTADTIARAMPDLISGMFRRIVVPLRWPHRLPLPANRRFDTAQATLDTTIATITAAMRAGSASPGGLMKLLQGQSHQDTVQTHTKTLLTAGSDTTAALLAWTLHLLARHPGVQERLQAEIDAELSGRRTAFEDLSRLSYTKLVLTEALRIYPPAWLLSRVTTRSVVLGGYTLAPGSDILVVPYLLHRDPAVFPDPERFDPDRWEPAHTTPAQREAFMPMGVGRRKCIGDVFAMTEASIALATITARWTLRPADTKAVKPSLRIVLHPADLRLTVHARERRPEKA